MELCQICNPEVEDQFDEDFLPERGQTSHPRQDALQISLSALDITLKDAFNLCERQAIIGEVMPNPNGDFAYGINVGLEIGLAPDAFVTGNSLFKSFDGHLSMIMGQRQIREAKQVDQIENDADHNDHANEEKNRGVHRDALNEVEDDTNKHEAENES